MAATGAAPTTRELVAHEFTATICEDGRTAGEACSLLLALTGGEPSDEAIVWEYGTADRFAAAASGIAKKLGKINPAGRRQETERCLKVSAA